ncbi:MAG TPA: PEGA domain-containing protein [Gemmatimonadales bacterium]|nr:PEGA domain-containing protein [Gemmatimonadales bacterium]
MRTIVLTSGILALTGCAAVLGSSEKDFDLQSSPQGAEVYLDGNRLGTTPVKVRLDNHKTHTFVYKKEGYKDASCTLTKGTGGGWVVLDILSGVIPVVVDAATNSWSQTKGSACSSMLEPITVTAR